MNKLDKFTLAYIEAALWSTTDDDEDPLDANYDIDDLHQSTLEAAVRDCKKFQAEMAQFINDEHRVNKGSGKYSVDELAGHDFWLTREGHGAGFFDGDWSDEADVAMTAKSNEFGQANWYVGDDGKIYQLGEETVDED
jgi:hypothetical protein